MQNFNLPYEKIKDFLVFNLKTEAGLFLVRYSFKTTFKELAAFEEFFIVRQGWAYAEIIERLQNEKGALIPPTMMLEALLEFGSFSNEK